MIGAYRSQMPPGLRKSGMPDSVLIPAPVNATIWRELAIRYLANSSQSITMVAQLTGYSALSSFTRWFIAEFGTPPGKWRRTTLARNARHLQPPASNVSSIDAYAKTTTG